MSSIKLFTGKFFFGATPKAEGKNRKIFLHKLASILGMSATNMGRIAKENLKCTYYVLKERQMFSENAKIKLELPMPLIVLVQEQSIWPSQVLFKRKDLHYGCQGKS